MTILRRSTSFIVAQVLLLVVGLASSIVLARVLGPDGRGTIALVTLIVALATTFGAPGLATAFAYLGGKATYEPGEVVAAAIALAVAFGLTAAALLVLLAEPLLATVLRGMTWLELVITAASVPFAILTGLLLNILVGAGDAARAAWLQLVAGVFVAGVTIAAAVTGQGVLGVVVGTTSSAAIVAVWLAWLAARRDGLAIAGVRTVSRAAIAFGSRAYVGTIGSQFWARADFLILNYFAGTAAVGQYATATSLAERVWLLDTAVGQVTLGEVIRADPDASARLVAKTSRNVVFAGGLASIALALVSPWLVPILFGEDFAPAVVPLLLLLPGVLAIGASRPISAYFYGQLGRPQVTSAVSLITAAVGVVAYLILVPPFGAAGAALGSTIAYLVPIVIFLRIFCRPTGITARELLVVGGEDLAAYRNLAGQLTRRGDDGLRCGDCGAPRRGGEGFCLKCGRWFRGSSPPG